MPENPRAPRAEVVYRPPVELVRRLNPTDPDGLPWHWELRYYAGSPLGYITIGEITTQEVTAVEAMENLLQGIVRK